MNEQDFEAQLRADGYTEIESQTLEARPGKGRHRHLFAIRGLVLSGTFNVIIAARLPQELFWISRSALIADRCWPVRPRSDGRIKAQAPPIRNATRKNNAS